MHLPTRTNCGIRSSRPISAGLRGWTSPLSTTIPSRTTGGGSVGGDRGQPRLADRALSFGAGFDSGASAAARAGEGTAAAARGAGEQYTRPGCGDSAGAAGGDYRGFGVGQVDAGAPGAVQGRGAGAGAVGRRRSIVRLQIADRSGAAERRGAGGPDADRAYAALESNYVHQGIRSGARTVCRAAG